MPLLSTRTPLLVLTTTSQVGNSQPKCLGVLSPTLSTKYNLSSSISCIRAIWNRAPRRYKRQWNNLWAVALNFESSRLRLTKTVFLQHKMAEKLANLIAHRSLWMLHLVKLDEFFDPAPERPGKNHETPGSQWSQGL